MKRVFDIFLSLILIILLSLLMVFILIAIKLTSKGPILFWSNRMGKSNVFFKMPKFRSMKTTTPILATHLLQDPELYLSPIGSFLRKYSLDELPQLFNVIKGDMSLVGYRPALFNQDNLINMRKEKGLENILPGITGLAQINGRDDLTIPEKVSLDVEYMNSMSLALDIKILFLTFFKVFSKNGVSH